MKVVLQDLTKKFKSRDKKGKGEVVAVDHFTFEIPDGELVGLLGPSGCGKSTTLFMICGLQKPTEGRIFFGEDDVTELPPENRGVGVVFQNYALYPHLSVLQNITFPLENLKGKDKLTKDEMKEKAMEAARLVQIEKLVDRKPGELSGGQQQRVAIARALITKPDILLMDEPLCNLDVQLRVEMRTEMAFLFRKLGTTVFHVTHDPSEAFAMADRIVIMNKGNIDQIDSPKNCYRNPGTESVAALLGAGNRVHGYAREDGGTQIDLGGSVCGTLGRNGIRKDDMVTVRFRAENTVWTGSERQENSFPVAVEYSSFEGDYYRVMAKMGMGEPLCFLSRNYLEKGTEGYVNVEGDRLYVYGPETAA